MSKLVPAVLFQLSAVLVAIACAIASGYTLPAAILSVICELAHGFSANRTLSAESGEGRQGQSRKQALASYLPAASNRPGRKEMAGHL